MTSSSVFGSLLTTVGISNSSLSSVEHFQRRSASARYVAVPGVLSGGKVGKIMVSRFFSKENIQILLNQRAFHRSQRSSESKKCRSGPIFIYCKIMSYYNSFINRTWEVKID